MKYKKLAISSDDESFENIRFHGINYILMQGDAVIRSPLEEGRLRPDWREQEYGVVTSEDYFYAFRVEPMEKGKSRRLEIVVGSEGQELLVKEVEKIASEKDFS
ncbi:MAG: hypothetical protein PVJ67_06155 [Candidatus Pacearchaeota archaeon]|jgi:hypothetical protein